MSSIYLFYLSSSLILSMLYYFNIVCPPYFQLFLPWWREKTGFQQINFLVEQGFIIFFSQYLSRVWRFVKSISFTYFAIARRRECEDGSVIIKSVSMKILKRGEKWILKQCANFLIGQNHSWSQPLVHDAISPFCFHVD